MNLARCRQQTRRVMQALAVAAICALLLAPASVALANERGETPAPSGPGVFRVTEGGPQSPAGVAPAGANAPGAILATADDGGDWEYGIEGAAADLWQAVNAEAYGLHVWLDGWMTNRYYWTNNNAWEEDYKRHDLGGNNNNYVDAVDLGFYVGHGSPSSFTFSNAAHDDDRIVPSDCASAWGDNDNEWVALTSCQVLADSNLSAWRSCQNGQHLILGFVTNASAYNSYASTQAYHFGRYLTWGFNVPQAWYFACDVAQRGRTTRTIINELSHLNDNPRLDRWGPDSLDGDWWYQTHACGTETAIATPQGITALPALRVVPLDPAEAGATFERLNGIFGISGNAVQAAGGSDPADPFFTSIISDSVALEMDKTAGLYKYSNLAMLWTDVQAQQALAAHAAGGRGADAIDNDAARRLAENFLAQNGLLPADAVFTETVADTLSATMGGDPGDPAAAAVLTDTIDLMWQVQYARHLTVPAPVAGRGGTPQVDISIVGPGAKLKVYVANVASRGADGANPILGVQGGWRNVEQPISAASGEAALVEIADVEQLKALYLALEDQISLNDIPLDTVSREVVSHTLAYWEEPIGVNQNELIPVYEFKVSMVERTTGATVEDFAYVPANTLYMPPLAHIATIEPAGPVAPGTQVTLVAADASKTLKELGLGNFDFALGSGDPNAYQYEWFVESVDPANLLGTGMTLADYALPAIVEAKGATIPIILRVTDTGNPNQLSSTDVAQVAVQPPIFLPVVSDAP